MLKTIEQKFSFAIGIGIVLFVVCVLAFSLSSHKHEFLEIRATDLALVFFTYCLVVVGWATIKSNEALAKNIENPQVCLSWGDGKINPITGSVTAEFGIVNSGKSRAFLREVFVGFRNEPPVGSLPNYPVEEATLSKKKGGVYPPTSTHNRVDDVTFNIKATPIVYGFFRFTDIFGRTHIARFCGKIREDLRGMEVVGAEAWNEDVGPDQL